MATKRSPNRDRAFKLWRKSGGTLKLKELADQLGVSAGLIRKWKNIDSWDKRMNGNVTNDGNANNGNVTDHNNGKFAPGNKAAAGFGAPLCNDNAVGNCGGAPLGNANALIHGLYAKYLPAETFEIAQGIVVISPLDILWGNISIQYAAIIRAQSIMEVESKNELIKHIKTAGENSTTYEFQFAWDRQAAFMTAQSKAMTTLNKLIKQYDELCRSEMVTEEQRLRIEKLKISMKGQGEEAENQYENMTEAELLELAAKYERINN